MKKLFLFAIILLGAFSMKVKAQTIPVTDSVQVSLSGSSDPGGTITTYTMTQTSGPSAKVVNGNTVSPLFIFTVPGSYLFTGTISDSNGAMATGTIGFLVNGAMVITITINGVDYTNKVYNIKLH